MKHSPFIGRESEMETLEGLLSERTASLIVIRGRRRIGKSRLIEEFARRADKNIRQFSFIGTPPGKKTTKKMQHKEFVRQLARAGIPGIQPDDWGNMFWHLSKHTQSGPVLIILDEISWIGSKDPEFLGKLKNSWDMYFNKNPKLILILCGSVSSWIEENILQNTGFLGRIKKDIELEELPLNRCNAFWHPKEKKISSYEKFKLLSITGGVPLYLEQIKPNLTAEQNILNLCFKKDGLLANEFDKIFSEIFSKSTLAHKEIVSCLADGPKDLAQICKKMDKPLGGTYSKQLKELIKAGFVRRDFTWGLETGKASKLSRYRLSDNYLRFYLKYIAPNRAKIDKGSFTHAAFLNLPTWEISMGLQFENLVAHNRKALCKIIDISEEEIVMDGPFFQTPRARKKGCQIDYLIQTRFNTLYACEIKFSKHPVGQRVVEDVEDKISRLKFPKGFSVRPILVHVNGVEDSVCETGYFDKIIDFGELLETNA